MREKHKAVPEAHDLGKARTSRAVLLPAPGELGVPTPPFCRAGARDVPCPQVSVPAP